MTDGGAARPGPHNPAGAGAGTGTAEGNNAPSSGPTIATIALAVAPLVAAVGLLTATGTIGRVQRDHPDLFVTALGLVLVAGALWVLRGNLDENQHKTARFWLLFGSLAVALAGFLLAIGLAVEIAGDESRPRIAATLEEDGSTLKATVSASGLATSRRLAIEVDVLERSAENPDDVVDSSRIYRAYIGPDGDGNVSHPINVPLPNGGFTDVAIKGFTGSGSAACDDYPQENVADPHYGFGSGTGCVIIALTPLTP